MLDQVDRGQLSRGEPDLSGRHVALLDRRAGDVSIGEEAQAHATDVAIAQVAIDHDLKDLRRLVRRSMQLRCRQQARRSSSGRGTSSDRR